ncbi:hypothetical protein DPMN_026885 [Dreissena polymorpha]|uniref:Uncharacterized protein n=1 Tax=Dreissena polymorpha TaxID=45954 RepID=A0A9D4RD53_DREPO|nr:hypothetical protein DPMN_026885 [Dreissena polymorpha]
MAGVSPLKYRRSSYGSLAYVHADSKVLARLQHSSVVHMIHRTDTLVRLQPNVILVYSNASQQGLEEDYLMPRSHCNESGLRMSYD